LTAWVVKRERESGSRCVFLSTIGNSKQLDIVHRDPASWEYKWEAVLSQRECLAVITISLCHALRAIVSESFLPPSKYLGNPLSVLRVISGSDKLQPNPKDPFPEPESYESVSCGLKPERSGLVTMGTVIEPVPVTGLAANFSPIPQIAPPPLGKEITGAEKLDCSEDFSFSLRVRGVVFSQHLNSHLQTAYLDDETR
jgi:hypothetical protein